MCQYLTFLLKRNKNVIDQVGIKTILDSNETVKLISQDFDVSVKLLESYLTKSDFDDQLAYILFTSGSTGIPKGVMITKSNVAHYVEAFWNMDYIIDENDRWLQMFELTFDFSVMAYLLPLLKGACVYTIPKGELKFSYISELMEQKELTVAPMVPSVINYLRPYFSEISCPRMRYSIFCGEPLYENITGEWSKCIPNARIDNAYGPTECTVFCTYYTYKRDYDNDTHHGVLSIGKPMLNNIVTIINENNQIAGINETGELCLAGVQLSTGYFNNSRLNEEMFSLRDFNGQSTRFYHTGDLCILRENGNMDYVGRKDFQVKIQGFRVELSEIEYHAKIAIQDSAVLIALAIENTAGNFEIALVFESDEFEITQAKEYMKSKMPSYMIPTQYYFIKNFPLNINGKIDRKKIKSLINK